MASEIRVNQIQNRSGVGTITIGVSSITMSEETLHVGSAVTISSGIITATSVNASTVKVGTAVTISAGIITASSFLGDQGSFDILNGGINIALHVDGGAPANSLHVRNDGVVEAGTTISAGSSIVVGDSFVKEGAVGLGTTSTTGRDAGIGTAIGTLIFNATTSSIEAFGPGGWLEVKNLNVLTAEVMLIGGGGGGAGDNGGGGGAGALYFNSSQEIGASSFPMSITIGSGGVTEPTSSPTKIGVAGNDSTFGNVTAAGGGGGRSIANGPQPGAGASGGGGSSTETAGGTASASPGGSDGANSPTAGFGNPGGNGNPAPDQGAGGGGGAGGAGGPMTSPRVGGAGGIGLNYSITGSSVGYAGGGGGYADNTPSPSAGVPFGGGLGLHGPSSPAPASIAVDGKGGGGGGCRAVSPTALSNGGDGVCIIAYPGSSSRLTFSPGASVATDTSSRSGFVVHTISAPTTITALD
tara:strand:+ start:77 stop:1483 length:1407 start_codon:yes stop_codon:yes gene_type:complete